MIPKNKSKAALAKIANANQLYEDLANITVGDLLLRVQDLESILLNSPNLISDINYLRNEINNIRDQNLATLISIQSLANEINIKTISNEKTALQINTISLRLSIEIANAGIII